MSLIGPQGITGWPVSTRLHRIERANSVPIPLACDHLKTDIRAGFLEKMRPRRRTVAQLRRDSAGIRDNAVVLRSSDVAGMRRWTRLRRQQVVLSEKAVQRRAVEPERLGR